MSNNLYNGNCITPGEDVPLLGKVQSLSTLHPQGAVHKLGLVTTIIATSSEEASSPEMQNWEENTKCKLDRKTWGEKWTHLAHIHSSQKFSLGVVFRGSGRVPMSFSMLSSAP